MTPFGGQPGNFLEIRTWFVDHSQPRQHWASRIVSLDGDQATWIQQLREGWNDVLAPDIPTAYQLVHPQPVRGHADMWVTLDIILSQNIHIRRYSGLVTVAFLDDLEGNMRFAVAHSFPRMVSGFLIIDAVDLHHLCSPISSRRCSISYGWTSIPVNADARHLMRSGHAFQIFVPADSQQDPDRLVEVPDPAAIAEEHAEFGSDVTMQEDDEETPPGAQSPQDDGPEDHDPGTPDSSSSDLPRDILTLLNCYIYRLNHPPLHLFLNYVSGVPLLIELAHVLRVPRESFVASYPVWVRMVGQAQEDWSIIVQHLDDIPAASTERLVILDVEVHFPHMVGRVPAFPAATRRVLRVPPFITRQDVLRYAGVSQYCVVQHDSCLVYFNNEGWPILGPGPRQVQHGTYLRAIVPPASDGTLNTLQAIRQVETYVAGLLAAPGPEAPSPAPAPTPTPSPANTGFGPLPPCVSLHSFEIWHRELREAFDEHAHIENEDEGQALYADVWFIDNVNYKTCRQPAKIKLLDEDTLWFPQIMECWIHQMQASVPVRLHVVQPLPPATTLQSFTLHILIEQNIIEARAAAVVSMHIQERLEDKLWQSAFSLPRWVSTEDIIDATELNFLCEVRRCFAVCGRMHFQRFIREEIASGISIEIFSRHVREHECDPSASSWQDPYVPRIVRATSGRSLMQRAARQSRVASSAVVDLHAGVQDVTHPRLEAPAVTLRDLWQHHFDQCSDHDTDLLMVETWYLDHLRRPWSNEVRLTQLGSDFRAWEPRLRRAWTDWIIASRPVEFHVVVPESLDPAHGVRFQILVVQQPQPMRRAVLLAIHDETLAQDSQDRFAATISSTIDHWQLLDLAYYQQYCFEWYQWLYCQTFLGARDLSDGAILQVDDGMGFTLRVSSLQEPPQFSFDAVEEEQADGAAFIQLHVAKLSHCALSLLDQAEDLDGASVSIENTILMANSAEADFTSCKLHALTRATHYVMKEMWEALSDPLAPPLASAGDTHHAVRDQSSVQPRVTLSLDACLPSPLPPMSTDGAMLMHSDSPDWQDKLQQATLQFTWLPEGIQLHSCTYAALSEPHRFRETHFANQTVLFIDGAAYDGTAAWSVVCVKFDSQGTPALLGTIADVVSTCSAHPTWIGADVADNISAELTAFIYAAVIGITVDFGTTPVIAPDLELSALLAENRCTCSAHPCLVQLTQCLGSEFMKAAGTVQEVRAHRGHPWNELADGAAKFVLHTSTSIGQCQVPVLQDLLHANDVSWAWLSQQTTAFHHCLPPSPSPGIWFLTLPTKGDVKPPMAPEKGNPAPVQFTIVSANVLALDAVDETQQVLRSSRAMRLAAQWHQQKIAVVGLQETRRPTGRAVLDHYRTFSSGAEIAGVCPHHGCELWLHREIPWITLQGHGPLTFDQMQASVPLADPRRLVVNLTKQDLTVSFVVLHAPCRSATPGGALDAVQQWWNETIQLLRNLQLAPLTWLMADLNADLGMAPNEHFGSHGHQHDSPQASIAEEALLLLDFYAPTTFDWCHVGPSSTWKHPRGTDHRIDYVLCSKQAFELAHNSTILRDHDSGFSHEDHLPVSLTCRGWLQARAGRSKIRWDFAAMQDPVRCRQFQEALKTLPVPQWSADVDTHAEIWESNLLQLAQQFFTSHTNERSRPRLTEPTCNLIAFKRSVLDYGRRMNLMQDDDIKKHLKEIEKEIHQRVCQDQQDFYEHLVQQLADQGDIHNYKYVYKLLVRLGGRPGHKASGGKALPLLCPPGQAPLQTYEDQQMHWLKQFAAVEAGHVLSPDALQHLHHRGLGIDPAKLDKDAIPTLHELQMQIKKLKRGRAPGPNEIPTDLLKAGGQQLATITTKIALRGSEPLSWRAGKLIPLYKGKLCRSDPQAYRSIFVSNYTTKIYHASLRRHLLDAWSDALTHLQFGGRKQMAADLAHHCLQAHLEHATHHKIPAGILFVDMKAAFYSVVRQGLFEDAPDAAPYLHAMYKMGITPEHVAQLMETATDDVAVAGISAHALALLKDLLERTHFQVDGVNAFVLTTQGTRPGDPVGDAFFNLAMAVILRKVTDRIATSTKATWEGHAGTISSFDELRAPAPFAWFEIAFVDDCAVAMRAPNNDLLEVLAKSALQAIVIEARKRGLSLNFEIGKTELMVHWRGAGSRSFREKVAAQGNALAVPVDDEVLSLHCTLGYKHLGTWLQNNAASTRDARARLTEARKAWGPLVRPVFRRCQINAATKRQLFESLVMSRLLYNAHIWSMLSDDEFSKWANGLRSMVYPFVRSELRGLPPFQFDVDTLCGLAGLITPGDALHAARLRYFRCWIVGAPPLLWNLVHASASTSCSWLSSLRQSFAWFSTFYGARCGLTQDSSLVDWVTFVKIDERWKGRIRRAVHSCRQYRRQYAFVEVWKASFVSLMQEDGIGIPSHEATPVACWRCDLCSEVFQSKRALAMHASKVHGYKTLVKHFAADGTCAHCCRDFHSRARLCAHLRTADECFRRLRACFPPLALEVMKAKEAEDRVFANDLKRQGWGLTKALCPVVRAVGPGLPAPMTQDAQDMYQRWLLRAGTGDLTAVEALSGACIGNGAEAPIETEESNEIAFVYQSPA